MVLKLCGSKFPRRVIFGPPNSQKRPNLSYFRQKRTFYKFFLQVITDRVLKSFLVNILKMVLKLLGSKYPLGFILGHLKPKKWPI